MLQRRVPSLPGAQARRGLHGETRPQPRRQRIDPRSPGRLPAQRRLRRRGAAAAPNPAGRSSERHKSCVSRHLLASAGHEGCWRGVRAALRDQEAASRAHRRRHDADPGRRRRRPAISCRSSSSGADAQGGECNMSLKAPRRAASSPSTNGWRCSAPAAKPRAAATRLCPVVSDARRHPRRRRRQAERRRAGRRRRVDDGPLAVGYGTRFVCVK